MMHVIELGYRRKNEITERDRQLIYTEIVIIPNWEEKLILLLLLLLLMHTKHSLIHLIEHLNRTRNACNLS